VVAGAVALALVIALAWRARHDLAAAALYLAFLPFVLTDHYPYTYLQGVILLAAWIGALDGLARQAPLLPPHERIAALTARLERLLARGRGAAAGRPRPAGRRRRRR
jgi:hypothetical protein